MSSFHEAQINRLHHFYSTRDLRALAAPLVRRQQPQLLLLCRREVTPVVAAAASASAAPADLAAVLADLLKQRLFRELLLLLFIYLFFN